MSTYLVADIGATNARFQLTDGQGLIGSVVTLNTPEFARGSDLAKAAAEAMGAVDLAGVLFAIAGPVIEPGCGRMVNLPISFQHEQIAGRPVHLVNDFVAQAHAVPYCQRLQAIGEGVQREGVKAILGPGSGLGMATLIPSKGSWQVLASEGGHADLAPGSHLETELWSHLQQAHGHVSWETVLCGPGLVNLYQAMCALWGDQPQPLAAADITARGVDITDPICHQTLETFAGLLGAAAGNLALTVGAVGGVYIGGGIAPRLADFLTVSPLLRRFEERGDLSDYVRDIPLYLVLDEHPGLLGACHCLAQQLAQ